MRNLMFVCAGLALAGGIVSANLWRELRAERELTARLQAQVGELQAAQPATGGTPASSAPPGPEALTVAAASAAMAGQQPAAAKEAARPTPVTDVARMLLNQQELMKDPEYRKARLAQTRLSMPQNYPGLVEELGLTPEEADRLFDLLAENQLEMNDVSMLAATINGVPPDPAAAEDANRRRQEMQRRQDESLMAMLGGSRYPQWQEYLQTRGARQQVVQLSRQLEGVGVSLTPEQTRPLTAAYVDEQKRQREEMQRMVSSLRQAGPLDQARMAEEQHRLQSESNRRIIDAAKPHLNARQLEALQSSMDQQLQMNRATSRMLRQQQDAQGQVPVTTFSIVTAPAQPVP